MTPVGMPPDPLTWLKDTNLLTNDQMAALQNIRKQAKRVLDEQSIIHYTGHGIEHSDRVLENLRRLTIDNLRSQDDRLRLNTPEIISLASACYLHDIGMQALVFVQDEAETSGFTTELADKVRAHHADYSARLIEGSLGSERHKFPTLGLDQDPVIESLVEVIRDIVRGHSGSLPDLSQGKMLFNQQVRVGFLIALFRLSDALDLNETRVRMEQLKRFRIPERSQLHWWRHHYVRSIIIENGIISVYMSLPPSLGIVFIDYFKELVLDEIRRELKPCDRVLFRNGIRFLLDEHVDVTQDETLSRRVPPANLIAFIEKELQDRGERFAQIVNRSRQVTPTAATPRDWISYWKFKGNPWVDLPLQYRDEEFVETDNIREILSELQAIVKGNRGDLRILVGKEGSGKTTFFNVFSDLFPGQDVRTRYLDISEDIFEIHHPKEIYDWLFRRVFEALTADSAEQFSESKLRRELRSYGRGKLVVGIDNLDRFIRPEEQELMKQFFVMSQGLLQDLKSKCVIVMASAPQWERMLRSQELHYLSTRRLWTLKPFTKQEVRDLLDKRLRPSGLKFENVFDEAVLAPILSLSEGNPRRVVQLAEDLCIRAAATKATQIDAKFVESQLMYEVLPRMQEEIKRIAAISDYYTEAVARIFLFHERLDRQRLAPEVGWEIAQRILEGAKVVLMEVDENYLSALAYVSTRFSRPLGPDTFEVTLAARPEIRDFCKKWLETGFGVRDFITSFRLNPWSPTRVGAEIATRIFEIDTTGPAKEFLDEAKEGYDRVLGQRSSPVASILSSWEVIENLLKALYLHHGVMSAEEVASFTVRDSLGRVRRDNQAAIQEAHALLGGLTRLAGLTGYIRYFDEIYFLANKRERVLRTPSKYLIDFTDRDGELSKLSMKKIFFELLPVFQTRRSTPPH